MSQAFLSRLQKKRKANHHHHYQHNPRKQGGVNHETPPEINGLENRKCKVINTFRVWLLTKTNDFKKPSASSIKKKKIGDADMRNDRE